MAIPFILFIIIIVLCFFAYCDNQNRAKKKRELEEERQLEEKRQQQELEWELKWEREAKQRQLEQEALARRMEQEEDASKQLAAKRAAEPIIFNLTITEKDANDVEISAPKTLTVKVSLDKETSSRLVSILRG